MNTNLMNNVNTELTQNASPYLLYSGETLVASKYSYYPYIGTSELDADILRLVNSYLMLTSKMIHKLLEIEGHDVSITDVKKRIKCLAHFRALCGYRFCTDEAHSSYMVYKIGPNAGYIEDYKMPTRLRGYVNNMINEKCDKVKRLLASNQVLSSLYHKAGCEVASGLIINSAKGSLFRANMIKIGDETYFAEAIRREKNALTDLTDKINRADKVLNFGNNTQNVSRGTMIVSAEDEVHMYEVHNAIKNLKLHNIKLVVTFDTSTNSDSPVLLTIEPQHATTLNKLFALFKK